MWEPIGRLVAKRASNFSKIRMVASLYWGGKRMTQEKSWLAKLDTWRRCDKGTKLEESGQLTGYRIHTK